MKQTRFTDEPIIGILPEHGRRIRRRRDVRGPLPERKARAEPRATSRLRDLNAHWFMSLAETREKPEDQQRHDNEDRPHRAIGCTVPIAMHHRDGVTSPSS